VKQVGEFKNLALVIKAELPGYFVEKRIWKSILFQLLNPLRAAIRFRSRVQLKLSILP